MTNAAVTNSFTAGTTIVASQVNQNFTDLLTFLNTTGVSTFQANATIDQAALKTGGSLVGAGKILRSNSSSGTAVATWSDSLQAMLRDTALGATVKASAYDPYQANVDSNSLSSGNLVLSAMYLQEDVTLTGLCFHSGSVTTSFTANNNNKVALYTSDGTTLTRVAQSANNAALLVQNGTPAGVFEPFSSTYAATAGMYYGAVLYNASVTTTAPVMRSMTTLTIAPDSRWGGNRFISLAGQTDMPASFLLSSAVRLTGSRLMGVYA